MADFTTNDLGQNGNVFTRMLDAIWHGMMWLGESNSRTQKLQALANLSDEDLKERGLTRAEAVRALFTDGYSC